MFRQDNVYLALSVWRAMSDLMFIVYGKNEAIGDFLAEKVRWFKAGNTVRSTQSITIADLANKYNFKIYTLSKTPEELYSLFQMRNGCRKIPFSAIIPLNGISAPGVSASPCS